MMNVTVTMNDGAQESIDCKAMIIGIIKEDGYVGSIVSATFEELGKMLVNIGSCVHEHVLEDDA